MSNVRRLVRYMGTWMFGLLIASSVVQQACADSISKDIRTYRLPFQAGSASPDRNTTIELNAALSSLQSVGMCPVEIIILSAVPSREERRLPAALALRMARQVRMARLLEDAGVPKRAIYYDEIVSPGYVEAKDGESGNVIMEVVGLPAGPTCSSPVGKAGLHFYSHATGGV